MSYIILKTFFPLSTEFGNPQQVSDVTSTSSLLSDGASNAVNYILDQPHSNIPFSAPSTSNCYASRNGNNGANTELPVIPNVIRTTTSIKLHDSYQVNNVDLIFNI